MERSLDLLVGILAVLKAGGPYVPVDPAYPEERVRLILEDCGAPVVLTHQKLAALAPGRSLCLDALPEAPETISAPATVTPENLAYLIYTSGSTGIPKGVAMTHGALSNLIAWQNETLPLRGSARVLQFSALSFDVSFQELFSTWCAGGELISIPEELRRDPDALIQLIDQQQIERVFLPFVALQQLAAAACARPLYPASLRDVITAGEQLQITPEIRQMFTRLSTARLHNHYGPSETHVVTSHTLQDDPEQWPLLPPIGRAIPGASLYLLDRAMQLAPQGVPGELHVGGVALARGYWQRPELTAEKFIADPFSTQPGARLYKTGDLARRLPNGDLEFLGRLDQQVKIRGFRVELGEIEAALQQHPGVRDCVVVARADEGGPKRLVAYVTGIDASATGELRKRLQGQLPEYMVPSAFVALDALPLTPNGKLNRKALPAPEYTGEDGAYVAPRTPSEEVMAAIWAGVLRVERVGANDHFFDLGGHSLMATQVMSRIREAFQVELPLRALFEAPTVAGLAERVALLQREQHGLEAPPLTRIPREGAIPLSFAQQRLWFLDQLEPMNPLYNMPYVMRLSGALDVAVLEQAINTLGERHETLRTRFELIDGNPAQIIEPWQPLHIAVEDLTVMPADQRESEARQLVRAETSTPFDLRKGPLLRVLLVRIDAADHVLVLNTHHIIGDGWSFRVVTQELAALYEAYAAGKPSPLPELPLQYADFAVWQRNFLSGEQLERQLGYWKEQLAGAPPVLDLPADYTRPALATYDGALRAVVLPRPLLDALNAISRQHGVTLFMTLLSGFSVLLARYTGQDDIVVGSPIANRNRVEIENLIGFFVNMLVLRTNTDGNPAFPELLRRVRETTMEAYAHQDVPFEKLVEELQPERDLSRNPLFQVMLVLQNAGGGELRLGDIAAKPFGGGAQSSKFDLTLFASEQPAGLRLAIEYNTALFAPHTIERMLGHFQTLLEAIAKSPASKLSELPLLSEEEEQQLAGWNNTARDYPQDVALHQFFERQAARVPDATALVCNGERFSYRELNARANQVAHYLRARGRGARCAGRHLHAAHARDAHRHPRHLEIGQRVCADRSRCIRPSALATFWPTRWHRWCSRSNRCSPRCRSSPARRFVSIQIGRRLRANLKPIRSRTRKQGISRMCCSPRARPGGPRVWPSSIAVPRRSCTGRSKYSARTIWPACCCRRRCVSICRSSKSSRR